jgi:3',5'-cyclic-AMP phosphodiesterase
VDFDSATHQYLHYEEVTGDGRPGHRRQRRPLS